MYQSLCFHLLHENTNLHFLKYTQFKYYLKTKKDKSKSYNASVSNTILFY